jgi:predicted nucleic acid-binding protein
MPGFSTHSLERDPRKVCLGLLEVFNKLYGNIVVPEAVKTELEVGQNNLSIRLFKS